MALTMTDGTLTPADFMDRKFCDWFRVSQAKRGPKLCYACKTCHTLSRTKTCPAFRNGEELDKK